MTSFLPQPRISLGLRLVAAVRAGAVVAGVSGSRVAHVHDAAEGTMSWGRLRGRTVCGVRDAYPLPAGSLRPGGRTVCRRCAALIPACVGRSSERALLGPGVDAATGRRIIAEAFGHLTPDDLSRVAGMCTSIDEVHEAGRVATEVHGHSQTGDPRDPRQQMHAALSRARRRLVEAALTDTERAARAEAAEDEAFERRRLDRQRRIDVRLERIRERHRMGSYLTPWERDQLAAAS